MYIVIINVKMIVELNWTRARAFNFKIEQKLNKDSSLDELSRMHLSLFERIERVRVFRSTNWIEYEFFLRSNAQLELVVWAEIRIECSTHGLSARFEISSWVRTCRFVRRVDLSDQVYVRGPCPWTSSNVLTLELSFESCSSSRIEFDWKKKSCPNSTRRFSQ
jgi:hypothetical protein